MFDDAGGLDAHLHDVLVRGDVLWQEHLLAPAEEVPGALHQLEAGPEAVGGLNGARVPKALDAGAVLQKGRGLKEGRGKILGKK